MNESGPSRGNASPSLRLAELLAEKFCQELNGSLVTMTGGLELAADQPAASLAGLAVVASAAREIVLRLRLWRAAWAGGGAAMNLGELQAFAVALAAARPLRLDVSEMRNDSVFSPPAARLLLNVLLLAAESLPGGGRLALAGSPRGDVVAIIEGPRAAWPPGFATFLGDEAAAWAAVAAKKAVQAPLTALIAHASGLGLSMLIPAGRARPALPPPLLLRLAPPAGAPRLN